MNTLHKVLFKNFSSSSVKLKNIKLTNTKVKGVSSHQWLERQLKDPYVETAKINNYRCRSAFKLIEIDDKYKFLQPGSIVVDCGASPGSWTQVAIKRVNSNKDNDNLNVGKVIAIDKQPIYPLQGAILLNNMDFTQETSQRRIEETLEGEKANVILSDMAPSATGIRALDQENITNLCYSVLRFSLKNTKKDGTILIKMWQCSEVKNLEINIEKFYNNVKIVKPPSSRSDSAEIYLLGRGFKGIKV